MNVSSTPLHRQHLAPGTTAQTYRTELAEHAARFGGTADSFTSQIVEITSLQSEGSVKRSIGDTDQKNCTLADLQALDAEFSQDASALPRLMTRGSELDAEAVDVVRSVAERLASLNGGDSQGFFLQPAGYCGEMLEFRATRSERGLLQMFNVSLHDTPGLDNGLLLVTPVDSREVAMVAHQVYRDNRSTPGIYLDAPEQGWQLHKEAFGS